MRCDEIMKRRVEFVRPHDTVQSAARKMRDRTVGFLPVCDEDGRPVGVVTDRDLATRVLADGLGSETRVEQVMSKELVTCDVEESLDRAERAMAQAQKSRILCVDGGGVLCGVISLSDVAQHDEAGHVADTLRRVTRREAQLSP